MARPAKTSVDYFPHMAHSGKTIAILEARWGNDGYAFWFKLLELLGTAFVNARVVFVRAFGEIYLGLNDVVKRHRVVACLLACFFGTKHVVGTALHLFHECFGRAHATEWFYFGHDIYLFT